jgi:quercetin dioxygenase-like cupin family protein
MSFIKSNDVTWEQLEWGDLGWVVHPGRVPEASELTVLDVIIQPGEGHAFHKHPNQQEAIYVIEGEIEQWLGEQSQILGVHESVFIPMDTVHASFVAADAPAPARLVVVLGPSYSDVGYVAVDVSTKEPWASLRG